MIAFWKTQELSWHLTRLENILQIHIRRKIQLVYSPVLGIKFFLFEAFFLSFICSSFEKNQSHQHVFVLKSLNM